MVVVAFQRKVDRFGDEIGAGLQEQASNHLKLLWSKAMVVSVWEKSRHRIVAGVTQRDERKRTIR